MELIIELGTEANVDELEQLYDDLNDYLEMGVNYPGWKKGVYPIREDAEAGIKQGNLFVAKYNGKIVGSIILNHIPEEAYHEAKWGIESDYLDVFVIHTLVVQKDYIKCGIGRKLMEFAERYGRTKQMKAIRLDVYEGNAPAMKLYESCGYQYIDTVDLGLGEFGLKWFRLYEKLI